MPLTYTPGILGPVVAPLTASGGSGAQTLLPTRTVPDGTGLDITALLAAPIRTTLQFANTGREVLFVLPAAASETVTVLIGVTILGQPVDPFPAGGDDGRSPVCFRPVLHGTGHAGHEHGHGCLVDHHQHPGRARSDPRRGLSGAEPVLHL